MQFLEAEALRLERTASLLARARAWQRDEHVLAPADSVLRRAIGAARHKARVLLTQRMAARLSVPMRDRLDALIAVDNDQPHSPLHRIKASSSNPSVGGTFRVPSADLRLRSRVVLPVLVVAGKVAIRLAPVVEGVLQALGAGLDRGLLDGSLGQMFLELEQVAV